AVLIGALSSSIPHQGIAPDALISGLSMSSPLAALAGGNSQYQAYAREIRDARGASGASDGRDGRDVRRLGRRRAFTVLAYGASTAGFALLVFVLAPSVGWRQWGVLGGIGVLLGVVGVRQYVALRENDRLLASNRELTAQLRHQAWFDELTGL